MTEVPYMSIETLPAPAVHEQPAASPATSPAPRPRLLIRPTPGWRPINLRELWHFRELLWFLAVRDIKVRYKQTALGVAWAILQPFLTMLVFTIFFGRLGGFDEKTGGLSYPVFVFCALVPWQL